MIPPHTNISIKYCHYILINLFDNYIVIINSPYSSTELVVQKPICPCNFFHNGTFT